jgi:hypothetical protein
MSLGGVRIEWTQFTGVAFHSGYQRFFPRQMKKPARF